MAIPSFPDVPGRRAWLVGLAIAAFVSCGAPAEKRGVVVTGELRADGTCSIAVDGRPIPADTLFARYERYTPTAGLPAGYTAHLVSCQPLARVHGASSRWQSTLLYVVIARKRGSALAPGRYRVLPKSLERGDSTAFEAALTYPRPGVEMVTVSGREGSVRIVRADTMRVVGSFRVVARRKRGSPFSRGPRSLAPTAGGGQRASSAHPAASARG